MQAKEAAASDPEPAGSSTTSESKELVPRRGSTSLVWRWFGFEKNDVVQDNVICKICRKSVTVKQSSTTNLIHHLRYNHSKEYEEFEKLRNSQQKTSTGRPKPQCAQQTLAESFSKRVPYERKSKRWQDVTNAVTKFIAREMLPMRLVESESFTELVNVLEPRYTVPSRKYFSGTALPTLYDDTRKAVEKAVQSLTHFATTTDLWSSRTSEPYLSLTIHFIDESWRLRSYCLQTSYFPESHTGEIIALGLKDALASWSLKEEAMVCMTTDSGANVVSALRINNWKRLPCFGHRLHIAIERSMRDTKIDRAIGVCKKVVGAFSNSWNLKKALADAQTQMKLPEHKLITECPTRWGSRQRMIERFVEQEKAIRHVLGEDKKRRQLIPSWQDIDVLESVSKALSPLLEFTDALSGEQVVTVSYLKPVLSLFNSEVLAEKSDDTQLTKQIKESILGYLNTKYRDDNVDDLLSVASTLDPRFKNRYNDDDQMIMSTISSELMAMTTQEESNEGAIAEGGAKGDSDTYEPAKKTKKSFGSYFKKSVREERESQANVIEKEIKSYLLIPEVDSDVNPLEWWKTQEINFPRLAKLAKKYLCVPASSSPSERAFSTGGNVVTCHRASLKPHSVDRLVFLAHNLKK
ncbi:E3 SUMO-protein ligase ZBED1-like [Brachyhypopomus gauderio]|uniref:E3 SUMO-protein ligase ZBED1-like n=1 Tax=Brachyhypopomus gauderio TaxID=698409 RepID=UPI0040438CC4